MAVGIFSKIKQLVQKVGKGLQWANDNVYKPFIKPFAKPILGALGPIGQTIGEGLDVASSFLDYGYGADKNSYWPVGHSVLQKFLTRNTRNTRNTQKSFNRKAQMNRFLMKATHLQQAGTIEEALLGNAVVPFTNDGEHHYSMKEIKSESQMPALFDKEINISLSDTDHDITQIQNSFLSVVLTSNIQLDDKFDKIDESYKDGQVLFVGLKSACGTYISM
ncbi:MAG: hypothetical protein EZS28_036248 [Streblomastix strix]|uniref:Uncharacterized protein n=1 Tax=Streblomastix strix TaxID=222440 RepID=A0A5J4UF87_9EUKA|nr:MAG: hypothetical protein EZS28_036248 [Streblomastix strix]